MARRIGKRARARLDHAAALTATRQAWLVKFRAANPIFLPEPVLERIAFYSVRNTPERLKPVVHAPDDWATIPEEGHNVGSQPELAVLMRVNRVLNDLVGPMLYCKVITSRPNEFLYKGDPDRVLNPIAQRSKADLLKLCISLHIEPLPIEQQVEQRLRQARLTAEREQRRQAAAELAKMGTLARVRVKTTRLSYGGKRDTSTNTNSSSAPKAAVDPHPSNRPGTPPPETRDFEKTCLREALELSCNELINSYRRAAKHGGISASCPNMTHFSIGAYSGRAVNTLDRVPYGWLPHKKLEEVFGSLLDTVHVPALCMSSPVPFPFRFGRSVPQPAPGQKPFTDETLHVHLDQGSLNPTWPILINGLTRVLVPMPYAPVYPRALMRPIANGLQRAVALIVAERGKREMAGSKVTFEVLIPRAAFGWMVWEARDEEVREAIEWTLRRVEATYRAYGEEDEKRAADKWDIKLVDQEATCEVCGCRA